MIFSTNRGGGAMQRNLERREFLATGVAMGALGLGAASTSVAADTKSTNLPLIQPGWNILFQGDSITDAGRKKDDPKVNDLASLGGGYAFLAAAELLVDHPDGDLKIYNRGISGNKVHQLAERWQQDCIDLKPNVLSVLIGVNDIWHGLNGQYDGTVETYRDDYRKLLERTKQELPEVKLVVCEPFVLRCGAVTDKWFPEFDKYRAAAKEIANEFATVWVPFQTMFDEAVKLAPPEHWAGDGVHPSPAGNALMAYTWMKCVNAA
jgi:lysophospholipase L1-like esterase